MVTVALTKTFPVVIGGIEESSNGVSSFCDKLGIMMDGGDGPHTLKRDSYSAQNTHQY